MSFTDSYTPKGRARGTVEAFGEATRLIEDNRSPIYVAYIVDTSGSMAGKSLVITETGEQAHVEKIEQLNQGVKQIMKALKEFEADNPLYKVYVQFIELNSYGQALFPTYQSLSRGFEEIRFEADGCTELRASLTTLKEFINDKHLKDERACREGKAYNKGVIVMLMSDGWPTDCNGIQQTKDAYRGVIDDFNQYLRDMGYARNVDLYSIAVGDDACEDMLRYFCDSGSNEGDGSRFYRVEKCQSIADALDVKTRATLAHHTTLPIYIDDDEDDVAADNDTDTPSGRSNGSVTRGTMTHSAKSINHVTETDESLDALFDGIE